MVEALLESGGQDVVVAHNGQSRAGTPTEYSPSIPQITPENLNLTNIQKFYAGQSIFITGGTGFLGKLLIEKLLRSCPGIANIYLLVRPKKGKNPYERTEELFDDPLFESLKKSVPKFRHQIVGIEGDCSKPGLGISESDKATLINEVSIVFHVAATVRFDEKIKLAVAINIQSVQDMIAMCKKMPKLKSFVHVSTAYAYCTQNPIEEKFYDPPIEADKLITMVECVDDHLANVITPHILGRWPNTYAFTKAVAESVVRKDGDDMPIGVFRPAIVISTYQEPIRGWIDNMYGPTGVAAGAGTGLLRTLHCDGSMQANVVPGDMVVNALIASAWDIAEIKKTNCNSDEIPIYNYVSKDNPITFDELKDLSAKHGIEYPSSKAIWYYSFRNNKYKIIHLLYVYFLHLLPAIVIDGATMCIGKQPRLLKVYKKIHRFMDVLNYFSTKRWDFANERVNSLHEKMHEEDRRKFFFDIKSLVWDKYFETYIQGIRTYLIKDPPETLPMARVKWQRMYWIHQAFKLLVAYVFLRVTWAIFSALVPTAS
ncbi:fatty acyl-CoA reductase wat-like [Venturia canescens]|uniref:fatty acyl-CoA reductase wat-like n=1 Tax=Venturia canescens TaxID=32260 RepID=UPI001C9C9956|nr:fatty acyl-CoA reductase wat-like [Venturia canescens]XP_043286817.1 fatty acyl-CoA reductase wat-like [Venturia canescens]